MKRFFAFIFLVLALSSCDDGDLTQVTFEFDDSLAKACGSETPDFFIYKIQDNRALIIQLSESNFQNRVSADLTTQPDLLDIEDLNLNIRVIYREYSGEITENTLCSTIPVSNPVVVEEREATKGKIKITTTAIKSEPDANGATKIIAYSHALVFTDLVFENQINEGFNQVIYQTTATAFNNFAGLNSLFSCENDDTFLFKYNPTQSLVLDLSEADAAFLFSNEAGPKTRLINDTNKLTHYFYNTDINTLNNAYFCTNPTPDTPPVIDAYFAENGIEGERGIIEVTSLASDNGFKHTIVLKKIRLVKGSLKVEMGDEFIFGEFETTN